MKTLLLSTILALVLCTTSCTTTNPDTGQREIDPVRTEKVCAVMQQAIASGIAIGLSKEPKALPGLVLVQQAACDLAQQGNASGQKVNDALLALDLKFLENPDAKLVVQLSINTLLGLYNAALADRVRADVAADVYAKNILGTLCTGLTQGITQARQSGFIQ